MDLSAQFPIKRETVGVAALVLTTVLAALGWFLSINALRGIAPLHFIAVRFLLAGALLLPFAWSGLRALTARELRAAAMTGFFLGLSMILWIEGLRFTENVGVGAFICGLGNILAPLVGRAIFRWSIATATWVAVGAATAGMALLSIDRGLSLSLGDVFFLGTAFATALNLTLTAKYAARISSVPLTTVQMIATGVVGYVCALSIETAPATIDAPTWFWLAACALIPSCSRFLLQIKGQSLAPLNRAALLLALEPVWTAVIAVFLLDAGLTGWQAAGCVLIFAATLVDGGGRARAA